MTAGIGFFVLPVVIAGGWQLAMRSKSPYGPYEWKRVLERGKTTMNGPHQGGWIHTKYSEDWFIHFQDKGPYGLRVSFTTCRLE